MSGPFNLAASTEQGARTYLKGAARGAGITDDFTSSSSSAASPVLFGNPFFRTGVTQSTFTENSNESANVKVKLHVFDAENSAENAIRVKVGEEEVTAYCTKADPGNIIDSGAKVDLVFVNNRWDIVNATCSEDDDG